MNNSFIKEYHSFIKRFKGVLIGLLFSLAGVAVGAAGVVTYVSTKGDLSSTEVASTTDSYQASTSESSNSEPRGILHSVINSVVHSTVPSKPANNSAQDNLEIQTTSATSGTTNLEIQNVKIVVNGGSADITWNTSVPARSQLILDNGNGKGYESINGVGTAHEVDLTGIVESEEYNFKIVAHTTDGTKDDDYFGTILAKKKYTGFISSYQNEEGCRTLVIEDTAGHPARNITVDVSGSYSNKVATFQIPHLTVTTDSNGEVQVWKNCETANFAISSSINVR